MIDENGGRWHRLKSAAERAGFTAPLILRWRKKKCPYLGRKIKWRRFEKETGRKDKYYAEADLDVIRKGYLEMPAIPTDDLDDLVPVQKILTARRISRALLSRRATQNRQVGKTHKKLGKRKGEHARPLPRAFKSKQFCKLLDADPRLKPLPPDSMDRNKAARQLGVSANFLVKLLQDRTIVAGKGRTPVDGTGSGQYAWGISNDIVAELETRADSLQSDAATRGETLPRPAAIRQAALMLKANRLQHEQNGQQHAANGSADPPLTAPDLTHVIWSHGESCYSIDGQPPRIVTNDQNNVLLAFLREGKAMGTETLKKKSDVEGVRRVMQELELVFGKRRALRPGVKGGPGYFIDVRRNATLSR
jgi:hypothetical protein